MRYAHAIGQFGKRLSQFLVDSCRAALYIRVQGTRPGNGCTVLYRVPNLEAGYRGEGGGRGRGRCDRSCACACAVVFVR